jgi:tripeptide aminopeptidase
MPVNPRNSPFSRVTALAGQRPVHAAFAWLHGNPKRIMDWQAELVAIPAPPFGEQARSAWLAAAFEKAGLAACKLIPSATCSDSSRSQPVAGKHRPHRRPFRAHLDTVFPAETPLDPVVNGDRLEAPGACDNGAGVVGLLAIANALAEPTSRIARIPALSWQRGRRRRRRSARRPPSLQPERAGRPHRRPHRSRRRRRRLRRHPGPGQQALPGGDHRPRRPQLYRRRNPQPHRRAGFRPGRPAETPCRDEPRTTFNLGTIQGGTSVNSIPESARPPSISAPPAPTSLCALKSPCIAPLKTPSSAPMRRQSAGATPARARCLRHPQNRRPPRRTSARRFPLLETLRAVDRHLGLRTDLRLGSTDANIPLSLSVPALSMGAGGEGGGAHTKSEWYSAKDREVGLKRVLLLTLAMTEWAAEQ